MITQRALSQALGSRGLVCPRPPQGSPRPGDRGVARHRACVLHADKRVEPGRRRSRGLPLRPGSGAPTNGGGRVCSKGFLAANLSLPPPTHTPRLGRLLPSLLRHCSAQGLMLAPPAPWRAWAGWFPAPKSPSAPRPTPDRGSQAPLAKPEPPGDTEPSPMPDLGACTSARSPSGRCEVRWAPAARPAEPASRRPEPPAAPANCASRRAAQRWARPEGAVKGTSPAEVGASLLLSGAPSPLGIAAGPSRQMAAGFGGGGLGRGAAAGLLAFLSPSGRRSLC